MEEELFENIKNKNLDKVKSCIENGVDLEYRNYYGYDPLHWAIEYSSVDIVKYLLEFKVNINNRNNHYQSPLHSAVFNNDIDKVKLLLEENCYLYFFDDRDQTPLHIAFLTNCFYEYDNLNIIDCLISNGADINFNGYGYFNSILHDFLDICYNDLSNKEQYNKIFLYLVTECKADIYTRPVTI